MSFTKEEYIQIINHLIETQTDYDISEFTGGSVGVTLINNSTQLKYKFTMYFGFKNKNAISKVIEVEKDTYNVLIKALEIKALSGINDDSKLTLSNIKDLLTTGSKEGITTVGTTSTKTNTINTNTNESKIKKDSVEEYSNDFEIIWKWYRENTSRPIGDKKSANKNFLKQLKNVEYVDIKKAIYNYVQECKKNESFTKHLASFLNTDLSQYIEAEVIKQTKIKKEILL